MPWTAKRADTPGASSTFTLTTFQRAGELAGCLLDAGGDQAARPAPGCPEIDQNGQLSRDGGVEVPFTDRTTQGKSRWQEPQRGVPDAATGTRFSVLHEGHSVISAMPGGYTPGGKVAYPLGYLYRRGSWSSLPTQSTM